MAGYTAEHVTVIRAQATKNPSTVSCPNCESAMKPVRSTADRYVPNTLLEDAFEGLPAGREWRLLSVDLLCETCSPSAVHVIL